MRKKAKIVYPSKQTINLAIQVRTINSPSRIIPLAIFLLIALVLFSKFAVADRLLRASSLEAEVRQKQAVLDALNVENEAYPQVLSEYSRYTSSWMNDEELWLVDRDRVFDILEQQIMPTANVRTAKISGNTLALALTGLSLRDASDIVYQLEQLPDVSAVSVATADSQDATPSQTKDTEISMVISLLHLDESGQPVSEPTTEDTQTNTAEDSGSLLGDAAAAVTDSVSNAMTQKAGDAQ